VIEVRELLLELNREEGMTIFLSSHRLEEAERVCNRIGLIRAGALVCEGELETLLSTGDRRVYRVVTGDLESAATRLESVAAIDRVSRADGALEIDIDEAAVASVPRLLVEDGFELLEYQPWRPGLEDLFRRYHGAGGERGEVQP
jgi:ABC-2 type transport system ATP-binding protein